MNLQNSNISAKSLLRKSITSLLRQEEHNQEISSSLCSAFLKNVPSSSLVLSYMSMKDEVNIDSINAYYHNSSIDLAIPYCIPHTNDMTFYLTRKDRSIENQINIGSFGIREPSLDLEPVQYKDYGSILVLTPGVAFDKEGYRLGRGKGFYDKFITNLKSSYPSSKITLYSLCFDYQVVTSVPHEEHDIKVDYILTPTKLYSLESLE